MNGSIEVRGKFITIKEIMNLSTPYEIVEIGELSNICHVDIKKSLIVDDDGFIRGNGDHCCWRN